MLFGLGVLLGAVSAALVTNRARESRRVEAIRRSLQLEGAGETFAEERVAGLPPPARRYFLHAIRPGTALAASVCLAMRGEIRTSPRAVWMPLSAREVLAPPAGFVWEATIGRTPIILRGADSFRNGAGRVHFALWGLLPVVTEESPDAACSAAGRLVGEAIWLPSALLPQRGVEWEAVDEETAKATVTIDGEAVPMTLSVSPDGRLRRCVVSRWGSQTENGRHAYIPFGVQVAEEREFDGYVIPSRVAGGWWIGTERYFEFFRATIEKAVFR